MQKGAFDDVTYKQLLLEFSTVNYRDFITFSAVIYWDLSVNYNR